MRFLLTCLMTLALASAWAADTPGKRPSTNSTPTTHADPDDPALEGLAVDLVATRDSGNFDRNIARVGTMVQYESIYDFVFIGASTNDFRQGDWSLRVNSLVGAVRKIDRATGEGIAARAAVAFKGSHTELHGEGTWNIRFSQSTGMELIANRDAVESMQALQRGIMANFLAASLDHAVTERLTVVGMPTYRRFSDGNEQTGLRAWAIYSLLPEQGLSLQFHARGYESTQNGGSAYFSPDRYERAEIGLRLRRSIGDWRVFATANAGRERINRDVEKPTVYAALTAQRNFANNAGLGMQLAYWRASDSSNNINATDRYSWRLARLYFTIPF